MHTYHAHQDVSVLGDCLEVPGLGFLAINAFVIHAAQPVVADTGLGLPDRDFLAALAEVIDPADVRWICPWVHTVDPAKYATSFQPLRDFGPSAVLSTHLPPVTGNTDALFTTLLGAPGAKPFTGPDQAALEAMLGTFQPV